MDDLKNTNDKTLHTFKEDMVLAIKENKNGIVKQIITEQEQKELEQEQKRIYSKRNKIYITVSALLIILAAAFVFFVFFKKEVELFIFKKNNSSIIFHENTSFIDITSKNKDKINQAIKEHINTKERKAFVLEGVYLTENKNVVGFSKLLSSINSSFSPNKDLFNDNFLVGVMNFDPNVGNDPDFILNKKEEVKEEVFEKVNNNIGVGIINNFITLSDSDFFQENTLTFKNEDSYKKAKELLGYLLSLISFEDHKIKISGIYSNELSTGNETLTLAEKRKKIGIDLLNEVLKEKYSEEQSKNLIIENQVLGISLNNIFDETQLEEMTLEEKRIKASLNNGIQYKIEAREETQINPIESKNITVNLQDELKKNAPINSNFKNGTNLFLLMKINIFNDFFNEIRAWENKMFFDLYGFFGYDISASTNYLLTKDFKDGFIQNKNARILYDDDGNIVMMYVYIDNDFIVFTNTEQAAREAILRVNSSKIKK